VHLSTRHLALLVCLVCSACFRKVLVAEPPFPAITDEDANRNVVEAVNATSNACVGRLNDAAKAQWDAEKANHRATVVGNVLATAFGGAAGGVSGIPALVNDSGPTKSQGLFTLAGGILAVAANIYTQVTVDKTATDELNKETDLLRSRFRNLAAKRSELLQALVAVSTAARIQKSLEDGPKDTDDAKKTLAQARAATLEAKKNFETILLDVYKASDACVGRNNAALIKLDGILRTAGIMPPVITQAPSIESTPATPSLVMRN